MHYHLQQFTYWYTKVFVILLQWFKERNDAKIMTNKHKIIIILMSSII